MATLQAPSVVAEWQNSLQELVDQITDWSTEEGWSVRTQEAHLLDGHPVPQTLIIEAPQGHLMLEWPVLEQSQNMRVKLFAWPTLYRVWLKKRANSFDWQIWTTSGIPIRQEWKRETFITLATDLMGAE